MTRLKILVIIKIAGLLLLLLSVLPSFAQPEQKLGNWIGVTSSQRFTEKWSTFLQGELRTWEIASNLNELLWRGSVLYDFTLKHRGEFGYVRVDTWPYEDEPYRKFFENRMFQSFLIKAQLGPFKFDNRFRLEQRWITTQEEGTKYSNRVRYMLAFKLPLNDKTGNPGKNFIRVFNELFWDFDSFDYWFDREAGKSGLNQNRLYGGLGRKLTEKSTLQFGFLWQHRPSADFFRLILGYSHNFDLRKGIG